MKTIPFLILFSLLVLYKPPDDENKILQNVNKANNNINEIRDLLKKEPDIKELQWNRYVTVNFEILSLDNNQGKYLSKNVENIKTWVLWRWGIKDVNFIKKCKIMCVPSKSLYNKLFSKNESVWRVDKDGYNIWLITEGVDWNIKLPFLMTEVVLANFEDTYKSKLPLWCYKGMSILNGPIKDIKSGLGFTNDISTSKILTMTLENYKSLNDKEKKVFDFQCSFFCLWIKQEYGIKVFLDFMSGTMVNKEQSLRFLGLGTYAECDGKLKLYLSKLSNGANYYFTW